MALVSRPMTLTLALKFQALALALKVCDGFIWKSAAMPVTVSASSSRGGATVLKVGGAILRPHFLASGGTKYCLDS